MHMHQGTAYRYGAWMPIAQNGTGPSTNPPYYGHIMVSKFIGNSDSTQVNNIDLHSDFYSAYAAYEDGKLARVIVLNLHEWNPPNASDYIITGTNTEGPETTFVLDTSVGYTYATVELMTAPGAASTTNITVAGVSYDYELAEGRAVVVGPKIAQVIYPDMGGKFVVKARASQALLLKFYQE
jgi:hypothetical protein